MSARTLALGSFTNPLNLVKIGDLWKVPTQPSDNKPEIKLEKCHRKVVEALLQELPKVHTNLCVNRCGRLQRITLGSGGRLLVEDATQAIIINELEAAFDFKVKVAKKGKGEASHTDPSGFPEVAWEDGEVHELTAADWIEADGVPNAVVVRLIRKEWEELRNAFPESESIQLLLHSGPLLKRFLELAQARGTVPNQWNFHPSSLRAELKAEGVTPLPKTDADLGKLLTQLINPLREAGYELLRLPHDVLGNPWSIRFFPSVVKSSEPTPNTVVEGNEPFSTEPTLPGDLFEEAS